MNSKNPTYFAARNGYQGFTSYFDEVFCPKEFTKIFILKGGPGTGKSTLMKKIRSAFGNLCESVESILCSSDPNSLDGVILTLGNRKIAILDGTSPHATDPTLPIALEEIVDLGRAVNEERIVPHRKELTKLLEQKKFSYKLAYHFLLVCGEIDGNYRAVCEQRCEGGEKSELKELLDGLCFCRQGKKKIRLYNAFGKDGLTEIGYAMDPNTRMIKIQNNAPLMQSLCQFISKQKKEFIFVPDALSGKTKCLYLPDVSIALVHDDTPLLNEEMQHIYDESLLLAQAHFADASKHHFKMEEIYRGSLQFDCLDETAEDLVEKIKVLFSIS